MKKGLKARLMFGFILTGGFISLGQSAAASAPEGSPVLTIHVASRTEVDSMTLIQAEKTATTIFKKAGIETRWVDPALMSNNEPARWGGSFPLSHLQLTIIPSFMADRLGLPYNLPDDALGLTPGSGPGRQSVYVLYDRIDALAMKHITYTHANTAQVLGHVIAHEIGHLLLNVQTHSATGIMRGHLDLWALRNAGYGHLLFTRQEAGAIRAEINRRFGK